MTYIIMIHESRMKYILIKLNTNLQRNVFSIIYQFYLIIFPLQLKKSLIHTAYRDLLSTQNLIFYKIIKIHAQGKIAIYVCNIKKYNHLSSLY